MNEHEISIAIEAALVARNPRQMQVAREALQPGYFLRAAGFLRDARRPVLIGTGFPVGDTFETDGPVGAIALYRTLEHLGNAPVLACAPPLADALAADYRVLPLLANDLADARRTAQEALDAIRPGVVLSIERPGLTADGRYYNMRGEDISARCGIFDPYLDLADCPTIAIGDGGNEIGMGNIAEAIAALDIRVSVTRCSELLVADVSNWGAYGLIALLGYWSGENLLERLAPREILAYLSARGSVDGVTRENTPTEDGLDASEGCAVIDQLSQIAQASAHN